MIKSYIAWQTKLAIIVHKSCKIVHRHRSHWFVSAIPEIAALPISKIKRFPLNSLSIDMSSKQLKCTHHTNDLKNKTISVTDSHHPKELRCRSTLIQLQVHYICREPHANGMHLQQSSAWSLPVTPVTIKQPPQLNRPIIRRRWYCQYFDYWSVHIRCMRRAKRCTFGIFYKNWYVLSSRVTGPALQPGNMTIVVPRLWQLECFSLLWIKQRVNPIAGQLTLHK